TFSGMWLALRRRLRISAILIGLALGTIGVRPAAASTLVDPRLHFRTLETAHFSIHFHQGEDAIARRLAVIAEDVWPRLGAALGVEAPARTHVILADQTELANGWATP